MGLFAEGEFKDRLILLYFLDRTGFLLTREQLVRAFTDNDWGDYFTVTLAIDGLWDARMIQRVKRPIGECIEITERGKYALGEFKKELPASLCREIEQYAKANSTFIRLSQENTATYRRLSESEYIVECRIVEGKRELLSISLNVPDRTSAASFVNKWTTNAPAVYSALLSAFSKGE